MIFQVLTDLFESLSLNMWETPYQQALMDAKREELSLMRKLDHFEMERTSKLNHEHDTSVNQSVDSIVDRDMDRQKTMNDMATTSVSLVSSISMEDGRRNQETEDRENEGTTETGESPITMMEVSFDTDKCVSCVVESKQTLVHSTTGRGYGVASTVISSGCYQWKVFVIY